MTSYFKVEIAGSTISDFLRCRVDRTTSEDSRMAEFEAELNNNYGRNAGKFNVGDEIIIYADQIDPATTKIFTGIVEDIKYHGDGVEDTLDLSGRDYTARMVDRNVEPEVYNNLQAGSIVKDIINKYTNDLTTTNVSIVGSAIQRITFNQIPVFDAVKQLAEMTNMNFYVDVDKDLHFQQLAGSSNGSTFDNTNVLRSDFTDRRDTIYNQIWVYGDRYLDGFKETFTYSGLASQGSQITLLYNPHNADVIVSGGKLQPGEIKGINLTTGSNVKYQVDYSNKQIIFVSGTSQGDNIPQSGNEILIYYDRGLPIIKVGTDDSSVARYGQRNKVIIDKNIKDPSTAEALMKSELSKYADPLKEGNLYLKGVINAIPGENCIVNLPQEGVSGLTYNIIGTTYDFTKEKLLADNVVNIKVNRDLPDLTDALRDVILGLRKVNAQEMTDSDILTRYQFSAGSQGIRVSGAQVWTRGIGSSFILGHPVNGLLGSYTTHTLGDWRGGSAIQWSGAYF